MRFALLGPIMLPRLRLLLPLLAACGGSDPQPHLLWDPGAGELSAFVFYAVIVASAAGTISEVIGDLQRAAGATERLFELLAIEPSIRAPANPTRLPVPARGTVAFDESPSTTHRPDTRRCPHSHWRWRRGKVALVGPSGAGKTTVFRLLRFYDPQRGMYSSTASRSTHRACQVRARVALVPQDPVIFAASVLDNVRYGRPDATEAEVEAACEAAYATEFIDTLPDRYHAFLGERGYACQRTTQQLAITRGSSPWHPAARPAPVRSMRRASGWCGGHWNG
jgi:ATP-binding cassette subfamily B protein